MTKEKTRGKSFSFKASRFEVWHNQRCTRRGALSALIHGLMGIENITFNVLSSTPIDHDKTFSMVAPEANEQEGLIEYGHVPSLGCHGVSPKRPVACQVYAQQGRIRFVMLSPLRYIDYHGAFV